MSCDITDLGDSAIPRPRSAYLKLAGRVRYRLSDIEAYERAGFVTDVSLFAAQVDASELKV